MNIQEESLELHEKLKGKLEVKSKIPLKTKKDLSLAYSPGVAEPCKRIAENTEDIYKYTMKGNTVAVVSDGSAVLGLGNIGAEASMPVMEGKAMLFKEFAELNAIPILIKDQDTKKTIETIKNIAPTFGGINLEDFKAPECFEIESELQNLGIPVMHDDQHGTAIVVLAGLINALKLKEKKPNEVRVVINGTGAAGVAIAKILSNYGFNQMILVDSKGAIYNGRDYLNSIKEGLAKITNTVCITCPECKECITGDLSSAVKNSDIFIGVSKAGLLTKEMVKSMAKDPIIFALANPNPEIMPDEAKEAGALIIATGRSDFPNQVNNVLAFPGVFKGALEIRAKRITEEMKVAAAKALASIVNEPTPEEIIPNPLDKSIVPIVAEAVKKAYSN